MKRFFLATAFVAVIAASSFTVLNNLGTGKVQKIQNKEVYILSEPERAYDVVFEYNNSLFYVGRPSINDYVNFSVKNAVNEGKKKSLEFDAVILNTNKNYLPIDGKKDMAIKYKD